MSVAGPQIDVFQPTGPDDVEAFHRILVECFGFPPPGEYDLADREGLENLRLVRRNGKLAGGLSVPITGQFWGGRSVPMGAVRAVGVAPEHRAKGVGGMLMRAVLQDLYDRGVPLSALYPATLPVYRHAGYEQAGSWTQYRLPTRQIDVRDRGLEAVRLDPTSLDMGAFNDLYGDLARTSAGMLDRSDWFWRNRFFTGPKRTPAYVFGVRGEHDGLQGYVSFSHRPVARGYELMVHDLVASTPAAMRRLWSLLADHRSLAPAVEWVGPPGEPLLLGLAEMEAEVARRLHWMLRLVDVEAALEARGYAQGLTAELHLDVHDEVMPVNHGHWLMQVANGIATVTKGGRGDLKIHVRGLAALYTGFMTPTGLAIAGLLEGPENAKSAAAAIFAGPAPWMVDFF
ncbi:MAG: putative acetyltransferase [Cyanobacteria bacterium RYN_339]|nr:putative acetyltransferase [Cyanobacteria bacterium RYN_339]